MKEIEPFHPPLVVCTVFQFWIHRVETRLLLFVIVVFRAYVVGRMVATVAAAVGHFSCSCFRFAAVLLLQLYLLLLSFRVLLFSQK